MCVNVIVTESITSSYIKETDEIKFSFVIHFPENKFRKDVKWSVSFRYSSHDTVVYHHFDDDHYLSIAFYNDQCFCGTNNTNRHIIIIIMHIIISISLYYLHDNNNIRVPNIIYYTFNKFASLLTLRTRHNIIVVKLTKCG